MTQAAAALNLDRFTPFNIELDSRCDILNDDGFHAILRLCWSGLIGLACLAPPCKEFSRLKLRPGGPKALRTPQHMDGVPGLTPGEQQKVHESALIHTRAQRLFLAICHKGGIGVYEQPPSAMSWLLPAMQHMIQEVQAHVAWVDACSHGLEYAKSWAFISSAPEISKVATLCTHGHRHESIAGKRTPSGAYVSTLTAEYPASLAQAIMQHCSFLVTRSGQGEVPLPQPQDTWERAFEGPRHRPCDGGGHTSWADHTVPHSTGPLAQVTVAWLQWAHENRLPHRILAHIREGVPEPPLTPEEADQAARLAFQALQQPCPASMLPEPGQNFRLALVETLASAFPIGGPHRGPHAVADQQPMGPGGQRHTQRGPGPGAVRGQLETRGGAPGDRSAAHRQGDRSGLGHQDGLHARHCPATLARGRRHRQVERGPCGGQGPTPRLGQLHLSSQQRCTFPERVALPLASDVKLAHMAEDPVGAIIGASFDFKAISRSR